MSTPNIGPPSAAKRKTPVRANEFGVHAQQSTSNLSEQVNSVPAAREANATTPSAALAMVQRMLSTEDQLVREHGVEPGTRAQAAFHEAGHVVVAATFGTSVRRCQVWRGWAFPGGIPARQWLGRTGYAGTAACSGGAITPATLFRLAVHNLAGWCGEIAVGLDHPASSVDERCIAAEQSNLIAPLLGIHPLVVKALAENAANSAIKYNRVQFEVIGAALRQDKILRGAALARLLGSVKPLDLGTFMRPKA